MAQICQKTGRINQKRRTRAALLAAAVELVQAGKVPALAEVADTAQISRATAYRYFASQEALLTEVALEISLAGAQRLLEAAPLPEEPAARLAEVCHRIQTLNLEHEPMIRAVLRASLTETADTSESALMSRRLRGGRRIDWLEQALEPVRNELEEAAFQRLVHALCLCVGIESLVVLRDVCGLDAEESREVSQWAAQTLLQGALAEKRAS